jgi:hypothetical protein
MYSTDSRLQISECIRIARLTRGDIEHSKLDKILVDVRAVAQKQEPDLRQGRNTFSYFTKMGRYWDLHPVCDGYLPNVS